MAYTWVMLGTMREWNVEEVSFRRSLVPTCLSLSQQRYEHIPFSPESLMQITVIPVHGTS
jgi:hypothetical protein